jgi:hypothetical protein
MTKIITCNTNGIRAAARKGFFDWLQLQQADVVCIQETKAQRHQLSDPLFSPAGYHCYYNDAIKPGYSGTALYSRVKPQRVTTSLGWDPADSEGRYLQADYKGVSVISLYLPSGSSSDEAQQRKYRFMDAFLDHLRSLRRKRREFIRGGPIVARPGPRTSGGGWITRSYPRPWRRRSAQPLSTRMSVSLIMLRRSWNTSSRSPARRRFELRPPMKPCTLFAFSQLPSGVHLPTGHVK